MPTARVAELQQAHVPKYFTGDKFVKPIYLSILRTRVYTQVWKETEGEPLSIRRGQALVRYMEALPIFISPRALVVGFHVEDPYALPFFCDHSDHRIIEEYVDNGFVKEEDKAEWREYQQYWSKHNVEAMLAGMLTDEEQELARRNVRYMDALSTGTGLRQMPDIELYFDTSINKIIELLREKLARLYQEKNESTDGRQGVEVALKINDVKAMLMAAEGLVKWTNRYVDLARQMAKNEKDPQRKEELLKIADNCAWVPGNPPRSFWEAVQSLWFTYLGYAHMETMGSGISFRLDQVLWSYYEKDVIINKTLPREKAMEIMQNFLLLVDELGRPSGKARRRSGQGVNYMASLTIGGVKVEDGADACNELTLLILDAIDDLRLTHPDFKFRWHPRVNPKVWRRVIEIVRSGLGQPSIKNDTVIIPGLMSSYGYSLEEARSWATVGCISPGPSINSMGQRRKNAEGWRVAKWLELALNNGVDPVPWAIEADYMGTAQSKKNVIQQIGPQTGDAARFTDFEEVFEALRQQTAYFIRRSLHIKSMSEHCVSALLKRPLLSCLYKQSTDACRDIMDCPEKGMPWANNVGIVDTVDALISLKKLVFDEKKYTMAQMLEALRADWQGYEEMRQDFINAPKFGNDDDFADEIATRTYTMIANEGCKVKDINGASPTPSGLIVTRMFQLAPGLGALPNGRKRGDYLADGGISPHAGYDRNGPMAAILSASKIDAVRQKANIFNQKLSPSSVEGEAGLKKFQDYIETAMNLGLDMIQFSVVDSATLRKAQKHPEKYPTLTVRVSGYNANFVDLNEFVQESIIERTEHAL